MLGGGLGWKKKDEVKETDLWSQLIHIIVQESHQEGLCLCGSDCWGEDLVLVGGHGFG